jgi:hypothetical protein
MIAGWQAWADRKAGADGFAIEFIGQSIRKVVSLHRTHGQLGMLLVGRTTESTDGRGSLRSEARGLGLAGDGKKFGRLARSRGSKAESQ